VRLLFVSTVYPNPREPVKGVFNRHLLRAVTAAGHEVRVIAPIPWTAGRRGLPTEPIQDADGPIVYHPRYWYTPKVLGSWSAAFYRWSIRSTVRRALDGFQPDAVVGYWAHPDGAVAVELARKVSATSAVMIGGSDVLILTDRPSRRKQVCDVLRSADVVLPVSDSLARRVVELGASANRTHVWRQGVDSGVFFHGDKASARQQLEITADSPVLVWIGRMEPVKGLDILLQACRQLVEERFAFRLYLVGDGGLRSQLKSQAESLSLQDRVVFVGPKPPERLGDWYRAADLTVLPSRSEGLPNVLRESVACGTPFVASDVGGIREIAEPGLDRLVPKENPRALASAIRNALTPSNHPPRRHTPPTWSESAERFCELLASARRTPTLSTSHTFATAR
jgi:teichuronic acid biosynthesis glycosyltransferase TuaC